MNVLSSGSRKRTKTKRQVETFEAKYFSFEGCASNDAYPHACPIRTQKNKTKKTLIFQMTASY